MTILHPGDIIHLALAGSGHTDTDMEKAKEVIAWYESHGITDILATVGTQTTKPELVAVIRKP